MPSSATSDTSTRRSTWPGSRGRPASGGKSRTSPTTTGTEADVSGREEQRDRQREQRNAHEKDVVDVVVGPAEPALDVPDRGPRPAHEQGHVICPLLSAPRS